MAITSHICQSLSIIDNYWQDINHCTNDRVENSVVANWETFAPFPENGFPVSLFFKLRSLLVTCRIILVVAFGFSPQILGRWQGPTNGTTYHLPFYFIPFSRTLNWTFFIIVVVLCGVNSIDLLFNVSIRTFVQKTISDKIVRIPSC